MRLFPQDLLKYQCCKRIYLQTAHCADDEIDRISNSPFWRCSNVSDNTVKEVGVAYFGKNSQCSHNLSKHLCLFLENLKN